MQVPPFLRQSRFEATNFQTKKLQEDNIFIQSNVLKLIQLSIEFISLTLTYVGTLMFDQFNGIYIFVRMLIRLALAFSYIKYMHAKARVYYKATRKKTICLCKRSIVNSCNSKCFSPKPFMDRIPGIFVPGKIENCIDVPSLTGRFLQKRLNLQV